MHDTLPPILSVWSGPAAPLCCLANKSQARQCSESLQSALEANLNGPGSMIYQTVWKPHTTPLGRQIYRLRASARRTSDNEPSLERSGWPTPTLGSPNSLRGHGQEPSIRKAGGHSVNLQDMVRLSGWTTPQAHDPSPRGSGQKLKHGTKHGCADLNADAVLSGWATPVGQQANGTPDAFLERKRKSMANGSQSMGVCLSDLNMQVQAWAGWNTPRATDGSNGGPNQAGGALTPDAALSGWPTPTSRDHKDGKECPNVPLNALLGRVAWLTANPQAARITADGTMLTGCSAGMESGGQLNPAFSGWLQGFPEAWCHAAISCQLPAPLRKAPKKPGA